MLEGSIEQIADHLTQLVDQGVRIELKGLSGEWHEVRPIYACDKGLIVRQIQHNHELRAPRDLAPSPCIPWSRIAGGRELVVCPACEGARVGGLDGLGAPDTGPCECCAATGRALSLIAWVLPAPTVPPTSETDA